MALGTRLMAFLITAHTLIFFAGMNGYVPQQNGANPHKAFLENATSQQLEQSVRGGGNESAIVTGDFGIAVKALDAINLIAAVLTGPYRLLANTGWPWMLRLLGQTLLGFLEIIAVVQFLRGAVF